MNGTSILFDSGEFSYFIQREKKTPFSHWKFEQKNEWKVNEMHSNWFVSSSKF